MIDNTSKIRQNPDKASSLSRELGYVSSGVFTQQPKKLIMALMLLLSATAVFGDGPYGDVTFRRMGTHNGNLIATIYFNQGDISGWSGWGYPPPRVEWPKGSGHEYGDENSILVVAEVIDTTGTIRHICSESTLDWDATDIDPITGQQMGWEPLPGYFNPGQDSPAMSDLPESWPDSWPDKWDQDDPGWPGSWNGYFGRDVFQADQESYFVMDDNYNVEFKHYVPDTTDLNRRGLGLKVSARGLQWSDPLAQDCLFWLYDITNVSTTTYDKIIFGEVFDARMGGMGEENDDLAEFISYGNMDITYSWDSDNSGSGGWSPVGYFGFAFLESPGIANDEIDNDDDGLIDERRDSGPGDWIFGPIGIYGEPKWHWSGDEDGDWVSFSDINGNEQWDIEELLNDDLGKDGIGPDHPLYPGPDTGEGDGIPTAGEPNFDKTDVDESDQIGLTSMDSHIENSIYIKDDAAVWNLLQPGRFNTPVLRPVNYEFFYGSGFFTLEPGKTERFSLAMVLGEDKDDILRNKKTVQNIYDANYRFKQPPLQPRVKGVAGDNQVTLYWDDRAERSLDPIYGYDFEGYMIYKSTWYDFSDANPVTDSYGNVVFFEPVAQFDLVDGLVGPHSICVGCEPIIDEPTGANLNMGSDSGIRHYWIDTDVVNGQTYYYAVVSYDKGYDTTFVRRGIYPPGDSLLIVASPSISSIEFELDRLGNVVGPGTNTAVLTPNAPSSGYIPPEIISFEHILGPGTGLIEYLILDPARVKDNHAYHVIFDDTSSEQITYSIWDVTDPYPILANQTGIDGDNSKEFDGLMLTIHNDKVVEYDSSNSGWSLVSKSNLILDVKNKKGDDTPLFRSPTDYMIVFDSTFVDTSINDNPAKFRIWDMTNPDNPKNVKFWYKNPSDNIDSLKGLLTGNLNDFIYIMAEDRDSNLVKSWKVALDEPLKIYDTTGVGQDIEIDTISVDPILPTVGDTLFIATVKPFRSGDVFELTTKSAYVDQSVAKSNLDRIVVVPNPYVAAASWEPRLPPGILSGRGERKIQFIHLPNKCTIRIYTVRGYLVRALEHDSPIDYGAVSWDLKTKDGMDAAYGLYFYHIDAGDLGEKLGKFAIIK